MAKKKTSRKKASKTTRSGASSTQPPTPTDDSGNLSILVEMESSSGMSGAMAMGISRDFAVPGFSLDEEFEPVSMAEDSDQAMGAMAAAETYVVRATIKRAADMDKVRQLPDVREVWLDTPISPFEDRDNNVEPDDNLGTGTCPIPPCDCAPTVPKGNMADVANYLKVNQLWSNGIRGNGIVVGVLDSGITAQGRPVKDGETNKRISRVIGGWPSDWGTESKKWGNHGNMCATDVLGMAPQAQLYDLRIAGSGGSPGTISRALQAFNWAINQHRSNGTPQVLTNSWGIFQENWDATYARNPNHPFTRKVVEAINEGILVLFAAGNCGDTCPDNRCGSDNGPGKSIWGANGHPLVMTVGAVNKNEQFIGYSSRGPAALDPNKPDFCSISHFTGYFNSDSGTSAATPICAGVVALLKQAKSSLSQAQCKAALKATAKDIGPSGFDTHSGSGIIRPRNAYNSLVFPRVTLQPACRTTLIPRCPRITVSGPRCVRRTLTDPGCIRRTVVGPTCVRPTVTGPRCPRRTLVGPGCIRPTLAGPRCPRLTVNGPTCPRPTRAGQLCPRPTLTVQCPPRVTRTFNCPRPTLSVRCPRLTNPATCNRPTLGAGCGPRVTFSAAMCTPVPFEEFDDQFVDDGGLDADWDDAWAVEDDWADYEAGYDPYLDDEWYDAEDYSAEDYDGYGDYDWDDDDG